MKTDTMRERLKDKTAFDEAVAALPEDQRGQFEELFLHIALQREHYHLPPTPFTFPTMEEMKVGDTTNCELLIERVAREHGGKNDGRSWGFDYWYGAGIHDRELPRFALTTLALDCWTKGEAHDMIHNAWGIVEWPAQNAYELRLWREAFIKVGFWCNMEDCEYHPPHSACSWPNCPFKDNGHQRKEVVAYRGSFTSNKRGLSWTLDKSRAEWFAARGDMARKGRQMRLWKCVIPGDRQLAHHINRNENEIVADVRGLKIEEVG